MARKQRTKLKEIVKPKHKIKKSEKESDRHQDDDFSFQSKNDK